MDLMLDDYQFELDGVVFGHGTVYPVGNVTGLGVAPLREKVFSRPGADGVAFGREYSDVLEVGFEDAGIKKPGDAAGAFDAMTVLRRAFQGDATRRSPRAVTSLAIRRPGAPVRLVYGRPGKWDPDLSSSVNGWIPWQGTFRVSEPVFYSDVEQVADVPIVPGETGGLHPTSGGGLVVEGGGLTSTGPSEQAGKITNGGDEDTWPIVTFTGPVTGPECQLRNANGGTKWSLKLAMSLADGESVTIDTRPWKRSVMRTDGASYAGAMRGRPSQSTIPPGSWAVVFRGTSNTGTANMRITWRDGHSSI